jgi:hypothetical protein
MSGADCLLICPPVWPDVGVVSGARHHAYQRADGGEEGVPPPRRRCSVWEGSKWTNFKVAGISYVDQHGPFRCMVSSDRGRDTGRDTRRAVGSWSRKLPSHRGFSRKAGSQRGGRRAATTTQVPLPLWCHHTTFCRMSIFHEKPTYADATILKALSVHKFSRVTPRNMGGETFVVRRVGAKISRISAGRRRRGTSSPPPRRRYPCSDLKCALNWRCPMLAY